MKHTRNEELLLHKTHAPRRSLHRSRCRCRRRLGCAHVVATIVVVVVVFIAAAAIVLIQFPLLLLLRLALLFLGELALLDMAAHTPLFLGEAGHVPAVAASTARSRRHSRRSCAARRRVGTEHVEPIAGGGTACAEVHGLDAVAAHQRVCLTVQHLLLLQLPVLQLMVISGFGGVRKVSARSE